MICAVLGNTLILIHVSSYFAGNLVIKLSLAVKDFMRMDSPSSHCQISPMTGNKTGFGISQNLVFVQKILGYWKVNNGSPT